MKTFYIDDETFFYKSNNNTILFTNNGSSIINTNSTSLTGPQGNIGPTGAVGVQGPTGAVGVQGPTGAVGVQGPTGSIGLQGHTGPTTPLLSAIDGIFTSSVSSGTQISSPPSVPTLIGTQIITLNSTNWNWSSPKKIGLNGIMVIENDLNAGAAVEATYTWSYKLGIQGSPLTDLSNTCKTDGYSPIAFGDGRVYFSVPIVINSSQTFSTGNTLELQIYCSCDKVNTEVYIPPSSIQGIFYALT
jgi:hypothetical protein